MPHEAIFVPVPFPIPLTKSASTGVPSIEVVETTSVKVISVKLKVPFANTIMNQHGYTLTVDTLDKNLYLNPGFALITMPTNSVMSSIDNKPYDSYTQVYVDNNYQYINNLTDAEVGSKITSLTDNLSTKILLFYKGKLVRVLPP